MGGLDKAQGVVEGAGSVVLAGSDELYKAGALDIDDALYLPDEEPADPLTAGVPGDDEHWHLDDDIAVGEVWFDPQARRPHDDAANLRYHDPRPGLLQQLRQARPDHLEPGRTVPKSGGQFRAESVERPGVFEDGPAYDSCGP